MKKNWIADAIKKPGALRKKIGVKKGDKIPVKTLNKLAEQKTKTGKTTVTARRARLAKTLKSFKK